MTARLQSHSPSRAAVSRVCALVALAGILLVPSVARAEAIFAISGRGWGHGIGMTQYGAMGYANQGRTYDWILAHYFQGTTLATRPELTVRVDLERDKSARSSWHITAASSATTLTVTDIRNGAHSLEVTRGASVWIKFAGGGAVVWSNRYDSVAKAHVPASIIATFPADVTASTGPLASSKVRILATSGPFAHSGVAWRGQIRFDPNTTTGHAIDYVPMEQYLRGVVPRESPSSWPVEALRAQAVAARSYAYDAAVDTDDTMWCTTMSQVYNGADRLVDGVAQSHETAKTDAAVSATANKYVVYGSKVVKTFFSSSSGGRTANSKDVWFSSRSDNDSPPYYTSVEDADDVAGNPNYRWTLSDMSGATLASKVRDADNGSDGKDPLEYSSASPATVTNVTLEPGTSGFVRYVTLKWSNGASYTITGPKLQSILRMKSSAFTVKLKNPPPPPVTATRFQENDARPLWTGPWSLIKNTSASGGAYRRASAAGASLTVMFKGASISWVGTKADHAGKASVSLDGGTPVTVDLYAASSKFRTTIWSKTGLAADTTHTLVVKVLGTHRSGSGGSYVYVDALDVNGTLLAVPRPPVWKRYQQNVTAAKYSAGWATSGLPGLSGGTHAYSRTTSATVTYTFTGTGVRWIGKKAVNYGRAWVSVDASTPVLIDLYSATTRNQLRLFESPLLLSGTHTLKITVAGTRNTKATDRYVDVDAFEALEPAK